MGLSDGLDVSLESVSICIVDGPAASFGKRALLGSRSRALKSRVDDISQIGLEAGPTTEWIAGSILEAGLPVVCLETRHVKAALSAMTLASGALVWRRLGRMISRRGPPRGSA